MSVPGYAAEIAATAGIGVALALIGGMGTIMGADWVHRLSPVVDPERWRVNASGRSASSRELNGGGTLPPSPTRPVFRNCSESGTRVMKSRPRGNSLDLRLIGD